MNEAIGILFGLLYCLGIMSTYSCLSKWLPGRVLPATISIPLYQSLLSLCYQIGFLLQAPFIGHTLALSLGAGSCAIIWLNREDIYGEIRKAVQILKNHPVIACPVLVLVGYSLSQVIFLTIKNEDALVYHLPRVFLFLQENTVFLESFSTYHQAVFPVGADLLFSPFIATNTMSGMAIFSLSSLLSLLLGSYCIARNWANQRQSFLCACVVLSMPCLLLAGHSVKNDIIAAGALIGVLSLVIYQRSQSSKTSYILIAAWLCAFAISAKTTSIAFLPGIFLLAITDLKSILNSLLSSLTQSPTRRAMFALFALGLLILSQFWLFGYNTIMHQGWSGPAEFKEMHVNHDGTSGAMANAVRYGVQSLELGYLSNTLSSEILTDSLSGHLLHFFNHKIDPIIGEKGASRWPFQIHWDPHENYVWFGMGGALALFLCLPYALVRSPRSIFFFLPSILYFMVVCMFVSWMPWNGRFFIVFFVGLTPALAMIVSRINQAKALNILIGLSLASAASTKALDFRQPLLPLGEELAYGDKDTLAGNLRSAVTERESAWANDRRNAELHLGSPGKLLDSIEKDAHVVLYIAEHTPNFGFFSSRPDIYWQPINYITGINRLIGPTEALVNAAHSSADYFLLIGSKSYKDAPYVIRSSEDQLAHLIKIDRELIMTHLPQANRVTETLDFNSATILKWREQGGHKNDK